MSTNLEAYISQATKKLEGNDIQTARLDTLLLLENVLAKDRGWILAHPEFILEESILKILNKLVAQRYHHEPIAYIIGRTEFYGRTFHVNHHVLEPRPESEMIIDLLKKLDPKNLTIVDVGTGSGALAITAKLEQPSSEVVGIDIDNNCLIVARANSINLNAEVTFLEGNLLSTLESDKKFIVLANLPYVPNNFKINPAAMNEPKIAIFGGPDGLDLYRQMFSQIQRRKNKPSLVLTESMPPQHNELAIIASKNGYALSDTADFIQLFKAV